MRKSRKKENIWLLIVSCLIILTAAVSGIIAYLMSESKTISNEFKPVLVTCEVQETFTDNVKTDVSVKNTGDVDAYIRATVIANWVSDEGKVHSSMPKAGTDYNITWSTTGWKVADDGYRYHVEKVASKANTAKLIDKVEEVTTAPAGFHLELQILATAIQANPEQVVEEAWGVTVKEGIIQ